MKTRQVTARFEFSMGFELDVSREEMIEMLKDILIDQIAYIDPEIEEEIVEN